MAKLYYESVKKGDRALNQVPTLWREQVKQMLIKDGWVFED